MDRFDRIFRNNPEWEDWEEQPGNEFVVVYKDKFYPVHRGLRPGRKSLFKLVR